MDEEVVCEGGGLLSKEFEELRIDDELQRVDDSVSRPARDEDSLHALSRRIGRNLENIKTVDTLQYST